MRKRTVHNILLVEDNPGDVRLIREALHECKAKYSLNVVTDGIEALDYLHKKGKYVQAKKPDIILLDLTLPQKDGNEVLAELKMDPDLRRIPVIVLTISRAEEDVIRSYDLHANSYLTKPADLDQCITMITVIENYWFTIVKLPPNGKRDK